MNKLVNEYAIEPSAVKSYKDFRYIFEKLGFSQGRLAVKIPMDWEKAALASCENDIDRKKIEQQLRDYGSHRFVEAGPTGNARLNGWADTVLAIHQRYELKGAISEKPTPVLDGKLPHTTIEECDENFLSIPREMAIARNAKEIAEVAKPLFKYSSRVVVIDPYFSPWDTDCKESLARFIELSRKEKCEYLEFVTEEKELHADKSLAKRNIDNALSEITSKLYGGGQRHPQLKMYFVPPPSDGDDFHHRFILSSFGAIRYDSGIAARAHKPGKEKQKNDVILVDTERHKQLLKRYYDGLPDFENPFIWEGPQQQNGFRMGRQ